jgi:hypothetical protein
MVDKAITALRTAIKTAEKQEPVAWMDEFGNVFPLGAQRGPKYLNEPMKPLYTTPPAAPVQEPVKPYAYEYGRDNGDGTYSVVIDKGSLVQTQPAVYNYVRPQNAHKDWPIKELFDRPPAAPVQEQVACKPLCELCVKRGYDFCANAAKTTPLPSPPAAQPAPTVQEPVKWSDYEPDGRRYPAVPDAFGTREGEHPQYIQGWNDCRAEMLRGKP